MWSAANATGNAVTLVFDTAGATAQRFRADPQAALLITTVPLIRDAESAGALRDGTSTLLGSTVAGVAVPPKSAKPDVSSPEKLKAALLAAKRIELLPSTAAIEVEHRQWHAEPARAQQRRSVVTRGNIPLARADENAGLLVRRNGEVPLSIFKWIRRWNEGDAGGIAFAACAPINICRFGRARDAPVGLCHDAQKTRERRSIRQLLRDLMQASFLQRNSDAPLSFL